MGNAAIQVPRQPSDLSLGPNDTVSFGIGTFVSQAAASPALTTKAHPSQTGNIIEVIAANGIAKVFTVDSQGGLHIPTLYLSGGLIRLTSGAQIYGSNTAAFINNVSIDGGDLTCDNIIVNKVIRLNVVTVNNVSGTYDTNVSLARQFNLNLAGNFTLLDPRNGFDGQQVIWRIKQDAVGGRTIALGNAFNTAGQTITLSTGPNQVDYLTGYYNSATSKWDVKIDKGY